MKDKNSKLNPLAIKANLAQQRYMANQGIPNQHDVNAEFYGDIQQQFGQGPNGKGPRGIDALVSGLSTGLKYGEKLKGISLRKEELEKYNRVMNYLDEVNNYAVSINNREMEKAEEIKKLMPYASAALGLSFSGQPYEETNKMISNLYSQLQKNDPSLQGQTFLGHIPNTPFVTIRDETGNNSVFDLGLIVGRDQVSDYEKSSIQRQVLGLKERGLDIQKQNADTSRMALDVRNNPSSLQTPSSTTPNVVENQYGSVPMEQIPTRALLSYQENINRQNNLGAEVPIILKQLNEARKIIEENPGLDTGWKTFVSGNDSLRASFLEGKDRAAYEKLDKIANRVVEAIIKAKGGTISDEERKIIKLGIFSTSQSDEAKLYNIQSIADELLISKVRQEFNETEILKGYMPTVSSFERFMEENPDKLQNLRKKYGFDYGVNEDEVQPNQSATRQDDMVRVIGPKGSSGKIHKSKLQEALGRGFKLNQ